MCYPSFTVFVRLCANQFVSGPSWEDSRLFCCLFVSVSVLVLGIRPRSFYMLVVKLCPVLLSCVFPFETGILLGSPG